MRRNWFKYVFSKQYRNTYKQLVVGIRELKSNYEQVTNQKNQDVAELKRRLSDNVKITDRQFSYLKKGFRQLIDQSDELNESLDKKPVINEILETSERLNKLAQDKELRDMSVSSWLERSPIKGIGPKKTQSIAELSFDGSVMGLMESFSQNSYLIQQYPDVFKSLNFLLTNMETLNQNSWRIDPNNISPETTKILRHTKTIVDVNEIEKQYQDFQEKLAGLGFVNQKDLAQEISSKIQYELENLNEKTLDELSESVQEILTKTEENKKNVLSLEEKLGEIKQVFDKIKTIEKLSDDELWQWYKLNTPEVLATLEKETGISFSKGIFGSLDDSEVAKIQKIQLSDVGIKATPRGSQVFGAQFMLYQKRSMLGDEMGLGKTFQSILVMNQLWQNNQRRQLLIVPASVLPNWEREIKKFSNLLPYVLHGGSRNKKFQHWKINSGIAITTYETAKTLFDKDLNSSLAEEMEYLNLDLVIVDEAHYIKNSESGRGRVVRSLLRKAEFAILLSGTPIENRVEEMISLIEPLQADVALKLEKQTDIPAAFRRTAGQVYLRRKTKDVLTELPEMIIENQIIEPSNDEEQAYFSAMADEKSHFMQIRHVTFNSEYNVQKNNKLERVAQIGNEAMENGRKVLIFSNFQDVLRQVHEKLGKYATPIIDGSTSVPKRQSIIDEFSKSNKLHVLIGNVQALGTGLNIQAASVVIFMEPQIKPSLEDQAMARSHRMGQSEIVLVYRLVYDAESEIKIDSRIDELLEAKRQDFKDYADESYAADTNAVAKVAIDAKVQNKIMSDERERLLREGKLATVSIDGEREFVVTANSALTK